MMRLLRTPAVFLSIGALCFMSILGGSFSGKSEVSKAAGKSSVVLFNDLRGHWSEYAVRKAAALGWVKGYPSGKFLPDRELTLLEAVVALINCRGEQVMASDSPNRGGSLIKVPWGQQYFDFAVSNQLVSEEVLKNFSPDLVASRAEVAMMICRLFQIPSVEEMEGKRSYSLDDGSGAFETYLPYIDAVMKRGIMRGYEDGSFAPGRGLTRGELASLLVNLADQGWISIPESRRAVGLLKSPASGRDGRWELATLKEIKKISIPSSAVCFAGRERCRIQDLSGCLVEIIMDEKKQPAVLALLEKAPGGSSLTKVKGSVESVVLGSDNLLVIKDLLGKERTFSLSLRATLESKKGLIGFSSLKKGDFVDVYLSGSTVEKAVLLDVRKVSGIVGSLKGGRLYLKGKSSKSALEWINNWEFARIVDQEGVVSGNPQRGDQVRIIYLDPKPEEIDDEIPLEIVILKRSEVKKEIGVVQKVAKKSNDYLLILEKNKEYEVDFDARVILSDGSRGKFSDLIPGMHVEIKIDGAGVVTEIRVSQ